jgi:hypothetical protein
MKATEARKLKPGDWVQALFGCYPKTAEVIAIEWPVFTLRTKTTRGEELVRTRNYRSIVATRPTPREAIQPSWLIWNEQETVTK